MKHKDTGQATENIWKITEESFLTILAPGVLLYVRDDIITPIQLEQVYLLSMELVEQYDCRYVICKANSSAMTTVETREITRKYLPPISKKLEQVIFVTEGEFYRIGLDFAMMGLELHCEILYLDSYAKALQQLNIDKSY